MPWSGTSGSQTFSRTDGTRTGSTTWQDAEAAGVDIVSDDHDTHDQDLANGINLCIKKDGGNTATADIPMGGFKFTGMGDGVADDDSATVGQLNSVASGNVESGTSMLFVQTSAPTGWTKSTSHDNKALRVVSGTASSGGSTGFTSVFASRTILKANLPSYNLTHSLSVGTSVTVTAAAALNNLKTDGSEVTASPGGQGGIARNLSTVANPSASLSGTLVSGTVSGTVSTGGSGTAMDFAVQYVDVIIATKD